MGPVRGPILITGGAGFVGRHLTRALARTWPEARIVWFTRQEGARIPTAGDAGEVELCVADLCSAESVDDALDEIRPGLVIHLAAQSSVAEADRGARDTWRTNLLGSFNLADAIARKAPAAALVVASSADVYGLGFNAGDATEETTPLPTNVYARSKLAAEAMFADVLPATTRLVVLRPTNHTGPGHDIRFALPSFAAQIARIEAGEAEPVLHTGNLAVERDFLDVGDVVDAYLAVISRLGELPLRALYNVGSGRSVSVRALLDLMLARAKTPIEVRADPSLFRKADVARTCVVPDRLRAATGWRPGRGMTEMTTELLDYWRARRGVA